VCVALFNQLLTRMIVAFRDCANIVDNILGPTTDESSYVIGSFKSDSLSASNDITASLHDIKHQLLMQRSNLIIEPPVKLTNGSSLVSPTTNGKDKPALMTRRELTDPFGSDEEDDKNEARTRKSPPKEMMSPLAIDNVRAD
jgi:hypothetical protein